MRVLHINVNYKATALHQLLLRQLNAIDIDNQVFVPTYDKSASAIVPDPYVHIVECFKERDRYLFDYKQMKIINTAEKLFDIQSFDLIHAYTLFTDGNCARYLSNKYKIPFVVAVRNTDINTFFKYQFFLRKRGLNILNEAQNIFFLSSSYKDYLLNKYVPEIFKESISGKTKIIPNGIDAFWFQNLFKTRNYSKITAKIAAKEVSLVYSGSVDSNKNVGLTIKAMDVLKAEGWKVHLQVVGPILDEKVFSEFKNHPNVTYIAKQPKEMLIKYYRNADIFVMPSHFESFGLVYAEAMSQGLPVIYTRGQGFHHQFNEGEVGFSVDSNNYKELAESIKKICKQYEVISKKCLINVERFRWEIIAKEYCKIYNKIASYSKRH